MVDYLHTVRVHIAGRMQGVGFRYWAERTAAELRLSGWVRNRRDGSVEVKITGARGDIDAMIERCRRGPPSAAVASVGIIEDGTPPSEGFEVLPTE